MEILVLFLLVTIAVLLILVLVKVSKPQEHEDSVTPKLDSISREITVASTKIEDLNKVNVVLYKTVEQKLAEIRQDNEKRLDQMRQTVDEKLQKTLESRLSTTFKTVSDQLEQVYRQLGEMQTLAKGVGNLEKVLTNVKTRGMWGELQAERILSEILLPEQYLKNVCTKKGSHDPVEFAVKLPGSNDDRPVFMPIDSKFPREDYERLCDATQNGDSEQIQALRTSLERRIKDEAKDIAQKYIDVPNTTDFAVMFLPIEGLYAEILAIPGMQEKLQHEYHVMIAGPATLASLLNSLQMGFRTLAIEKKSAEVWHVLGQVKTEFGKFAGTLERVQDKLASASKEVENAFVRQRAVDRRLRAVDAVEITSDINEQNLLEND